MRKNPRQARSKVTIDIILQATAQILEESTVEQLTTNHVARRAGVSIGTLYQYFPNKYALLTTLAERRRGQIGLILNEKIERAGKSDLETVAHEIVSTLITLLSESRANRELTHWLNIQHVMHPNDEKLVDKIAVLISRKLAEVSDVHLPSPKVTSFILTRSILETIRAAITEMPDMVKDKVFEDELVRLIAGFLQPIK